MKKFGLGLVAVATMMLASATVSAATPILPSAAHIALAPTVGARLGAPEHQGSKLKGSTTPLVIIGGLAAIGVVAAVAASGGHDHSVSP